MHTIYYELYILRLKFDLPLELTLGIRKQNNIIFNCVTPSAVISQGATPFYLMIFTLLILFDFIAPISVACQCFSTQTPGTHANSACKLDNGDTAVAEEKLSSACNYGCGASVEGYYKR